ncbi:MULTISPECIES: NADPH-dependent F420 reductase [Streptomyces]|uniref:NADPH-dependent F420 reductase n=1 Tax=Streptomyces TaxID=1883 RepID=UPI0024755320|nr:NAD(P)-binding domain-containing protein [Streptomyces sp. MAA16]MDH6696917.1 putative dinucleotide-binding enzyme [Streptomyces sp. MAA16]
MTRTVGIIGSGMIGGALARLAVAAGRDVVLANSRGPESLAPLVADLGARARAATPAEAARAGDLVVAAVPLGVHTLLPAAELAGLTVVDAMVYHPERDGRIAELDAGGITSSELVQRHLAGSRVVKTFATIDFHHLVALARPAGAPDRSALPLAGTDPTAKAEVVALLDVLGYDAVDIGTLADSGCLAPGTPAYVRPYMGDRPEGLDPEETRRWFLASRGVPVPAARVRELTGTAHRAS